MADVQTPEKEVSAQSGVSETTMAMTERAIMAKKKLRRKKIVKRTIAIVVVVAILGGGGFGLYKLLKGAEEDKQYLTEPIYRGSIQSTVTGSGITLAKDSATITLASGGIVEEVYVKDGQVVFAGDPLYVIDSSEAREAVKAAQETLENYQKQLAEIYASAAELTIRAPHAGKILEAAEISVGDMVSSGTHIAKLVDDSRMKLGLYFSYAYEADIYEGKSVTVSIPSTMTQLTGEIETVNKVTRISAEGSRLFEAVIVLDNPGVLTEGMAAAAIMYTSSGAEIYPYESGKLAYYKSTEIRAKATGEVLSVNLLNYGSVDAGDTLVELGAESNAQTIAALEKQIAAAQENLIKAEDNLNNFNAVAPISGTVLSCTLTPGDKVEAGRVAITIADTVVMTVEAQIDAINISNVKPGMYVDIVQWGRTGQNYFTGVIESVSLEGKYENGISYFPAIIKVDNYDGLLMTGMYVDYSFVASQSDDCLIAPVQAVKYTEFGTCVFVKSDTKPENALDLGENVDIPDGFYAIPVTTGLSNNTSVEIIEGVEEGMEVFTQYIVNQGDMYGMYG